MRLEKLLMRNLLLPKGPQGVADFLALEITGVRRPI